MRAVQELWFVTMTSGVLTFVATVLRDNGHLVWEADTPSEALAIIPRAAARSSVGRLRHAGNERHRRSSIGRGPVSGN